MAEVSVERAFVTELGHHFAEVAEISAKFFGSDSGVFPAFPVERLAGDVGRCAETRLADVPDSLGVGAGVEPVRWEDWDCVAARRSALGLHFRAGDSLSAEFDHQPSGTFGE